MTITPGPKHPLTLPHKTLIDRTNPRPIARIWLHCTASQPTATAEGILNFWQRERGWDSPGYHYLILADGTILGLYPEDRFTYGVRGYNEKGIHVSYVGGIDRQGKPSDTRTAAQRASQRELVLDLLARYPSASLSGHYAVAAKACPSFDVPRWAREQGIPDGRIADHPRSPVASF